MDTGHNFKVLEHKAAGHDGTLTDGDGLLIFKPALPQELEFYKVVQARDMSRDEPLASQDAPLHSWMPTYLGVLDEGAKVGSGGNAGLLEVDQRLSDSTDDLDLTSSQANGDKKYLVLENLLYGFSKPNVLDIKLGKILYDSKAPLEKRERLKKVSEETTSGSLCFRICGMKIQKNPSVLAQLSPEHYEEEAETDYVFINKLYGRSRTDHNVADAIALYFDNPHLSDTRKHQLKKMFLKRLQLFYNTILEEEVRMISSSLLFIYEGDPKRWDLLHDTDQLMRDDFIDSDEDDDEEVGEDRKQKDKKSTCLSSMSLIDFAHAEVTPGKGYDENVIEGVENLLGIFMKF
ncbi:inositol polyphosphate multikinase [Saccharomyces eubayanus]|uniref:inositol polyphosphate multikinase n=1 Tax=Saccharomyces eubayanus TaxID=1080349 RepID=UPI0006C362F0|nr:ARG82-like protein [Saccharomyces eubayanus]KOH01016.1 ARG82-like protein [Saccharomyces eubayanus]